jgi:hypothetical protein
MLIGIFKSDEEWSYSYEDGCPYILEEDYNPEDWELVTKAKKFKRLKTVNCFIDRGDIIECAVLDSLPDYDGKVIIFVNPIVGGKCLVVWNYHPENWEEM